jgi:hypothetical protein
MVQDSTAISKLNFHCLFGASSGIFPVEIRSAWTLFPTQLDLMLDVARLLRVFINKYSEERVESQHFDTLYRQRSQETALYILECSAVPRHLCLVNCQRDCAFQTSIPRLVHKHNHISERFPFHMFSVPLEVIGEREHDMDIIAGRSGCEFIFKGLKVISVIVLCSK